MKFYPIRIVVKSETQTVYGITIPQEIAEAWSGVSFSIIQKGDTIILQSGCSIKEKMEKYPNRLYW